MTKILKQLRTFLKESKFDRYYTIDRLIQFYSKKRKYQNIEDFLI